MLQPHALVVCYFGGELSEESLKKLNTLLRYDDSANAQHVAIAQFDSSDIAKVIAQKAVEEINENIPSNTEGLFFTKPSNHVRVNISKKQPSHIDSAITYVANNIEGATYKDSRRMPVVDIVHLYQDDSRTRIAFNIISNVDDDELFENETVKDCGVTKAFIKVLRDIVKKIQ